MTARATIPVDLRNFGQVLACIGLAETALVLNGQARAGFAWDGLGAAGEFTLETAGSDDPVAQVLEFLAHAEVVSLAPAGGGLDTDGWGTPTVLVDTDLSSFPIPPADSPATLPAALRVGDVAVVVWHWADGTGRDNLKFWAGAGGYPGAALLRDAQAMASGLDAAASSAPWSVEAPMSSSFRFDWRRDYVAREAGFSLNRHTEITPMGFPLVEIFAAVGASYARPAQVDGAPRSERKLWYRYGVIASAPVPLPMLRAALGCAALPYPTRQFTVRMGWPGKVGQARCITEVMEDES